MQKQTCHLHWMRYEQGNCWVWPFVKVEMSARFQQKCGTRCRSDGLGSCDPPHPELPTQVESKKVSVCRRHLNMTAPYRQCAQQNLLNHPSSTSNCNLLKFSESNPDIENNVRIDTRVSWRLRMSSSPKKHTTFFIPCLYKRGPRNSSNPSFIMSILDNIRTSDIPKFWRFCGLVYWTYPDLPAWWSTSITSGQVGRWVSQTLTRAPDSQDR